MTHFVARLANTVQLLSAGLLFVLVILTLWQVFARYVLGSPDPYSEEIIRFLLIWLGMLTGSYCVYIKAHVGFSLIVDKSASHLKSYINVLLRGLTAIFLLSVFCFGGGKLVWLTVVLQQKTPAMGIPVGFIYTIIPVTGLLATLFVLYQPKSPESTTIKE